MLAVLAIGLLAGFQGTVPSTFPVTVVQGGTGATSLSGAGIPKLLNIQYNLSPVTATNGVDTNLVSWTLPGGTASATNSRLQIDYMLQHSSGVASTSYKFGLGTCSLNLHGASAGTSVMGGQIVIMTLGASSESVAIYRYQTIAGAAAASLPPAACTVDMTTNQAITIAANEAVNNTEQYTQFDFQVTQVQ